MKRLLLASLLVAFAASGQAQQRGHKAAAAQPAPTAAMASDTSRSTSTSKGDSFALGLLAAVNEHEIAAAKQAKSKKVSGPVLDYATRMEKEHGENLTRTKALGALSNDAEIRAQKVKGADELKTLGQQNGSAYAKAYMDAMVKGHEQALNLIDTKMLPSAATAPVKKHLTETRAHVANHLAAAKEIVATL